jgi:hypothetical protein
MELIMSAALNSIKYKNSDHLYDIFLGHLRKKDLTKCNECLVHLNRIAKEGDSVPSLTRALDANSLVLEEIPAADKGSLTLKIQELTKRLEYFKPVPKATAVPQAAAVPKVLVCLKAAAG